MYFIKYENILTPARNLLPICWNEMITEHVSSTHWDSHNAFTKLLLTQNTLYLKIQFQFDIYECDCLFFTQTRPFNHCQYIFHQHPAFQIDAFKPIMKKRINNLLILKTLRLLQIIQNVPNIYQIYPLQNKFIRAALMLFLLCIT